MQTLNLSGIKFIIVFHIYLLIVIVYYLLQKVISTSPLKVENMFVRTSLFPIPMTSSVTITSVPHKLLRVNRDPCNITNPLKYVGVCMWVL